MSDKITMKGRVTSDVVREIVDQMRAEWGDTDIARHLDRLSRQMDADAHEESLIRADLAQFITDCSTPTFQLVRNALDALAERDKTIATLQGTCDEYETRIREQERTIAALKAHVAELEQALAERDLTISRLKDQARGWRECDGCEGTGDCAAHGLDPAPCSACNGTGKVRVTP